MILKSGPPLRRRKPSGSWARAAAPWGTRMT